MSSVVNGEGSPDWSRPALQRSDLGPIMHVLAHRVASQIEDIMPPYNESRDPVVEDMFPAPALGEFTHLVGQHIEGIGRIAIANIAVPRAAQALLDDHKDYGGFEDAADGQEYRDRLTFHHEFRDVLAEGVNSGIAMPLHVYRELVAYEFPRKPEWIGGPDAPYALIKQIDYEHLLKTLRDPGFDTVLRQLAHAANGFYGRPSSSPASYLSPNRLKDNPVFVHEPGESPVLKASFTDLKAASIHDAIAIGYESGGCPVRHSSFKNLGPYALRAFEQMHVDPDAIPVESAVSRYRRLVADLCERLIDYGKAVGVTHE